MNTALFLTRAADLENVPIGYTWQSKPLKAALWRLILYAISSGDWNPVHINPLTAYFYKSNLGGLTYCADLVLAITKSGFQQMIKFQEQPETIAIGYEDVKFDGPINVGTKFYYRFILKNREIRGRGSAKCIWRFEVIGCKTNKVLYSGQWTAWYMTVRRSVQGQIVQRFVKTCGLLFLTTLPFYWLLYRPLNEYCYPFAP